MSVRTEPSLALPRHVPAADPPDLLAPAEIALSTDGTTWIHGMPTVAGPIVAMRITLIARSAKPLSGGNFSSWRPAAEDRSQATARDNYRRRVLKSTVQVRNFGGS